MLDGGVRGVTVGGGVVGRLICRAAGPALGLLGPGRFACAERGEWGSIRGAENKRVVFISQPTRRGVGGTVR